MPRPLPTPPLPFRRPKAFPLPLAPLPTSPRVTPLTTLTTVATVVDVAALPRPPPPPPEADEAPPALLADAVALEALFDSALQPAPLVSVAVCVFVFAMF